MFTRTTFRRAVLGSAIALTLGLGPVSFAEPTTQPTTQPAAQAAIPSGVRVLVVPFDALGNAANGQWVGRAVQQSLVNDLARSNTIKTTAAATGVPYNDPAALLKLATDANADFVITGSVQSVEQDVRIIGQVIDVKTGGIVGVLKSTGPSRDLFALEDTVATQARRALPQDPAVAQAPPPAPAVATGPVRQPVDERTFVGSDLDRAVRMGTVNRPNVIDVGGAAERDYTYGDPYWGYPIYGGYGWSAPFYGYGSSVIIIRDSRRDDCNRGGHHSGHWGGAGTGRGGGTWASGGVTLGPVKSPHSAPILRGPNTVGFYPMTTGYYPLTLSAAPGGCAPNVAGYTQMTLSPQRR